MDNPLITMATIATTIARPFPCKRPQPTRLFGQIHFGGPRFKEDVITVRRNDPSSVAAVSQEFSLYYRVYNPSSVHSTESPPLVVIHGGPSLPSDYLFPLIHHFPTSRSIIFYDQLGCGRSSQPEQTCMYSIHNAVNDLKEIIHSLQLKKFHLLGHSFGGIVAYEYAKSNDVHCSACLSLTLNSTPANMGTSLEECSRLEAEIRRDLQLDDREPHEASRMVHDRLRKRNECRTEIMPDSLQAAIENRGTTFVPEAVSDYVAYPPSSLVFPPVLLIRGQYDFITDACIEGWRVIFGKDNNSRGHAYREETMENCAHYCHLEDAIRFGDLVKSHIFINDY